MHCAFTAAVPMERDTHTYTHAHTHARTHTHAHTHTRTHAHTHAHAHAYMRMLTLVEPGACGVQRCYSRRWSTAVVGTGHYHTAQQLGT